MVKYMQKRGQSTAVAVLCLVIAVLVAGSIMFDATAAHHEKEEKNEIGFIHMVFFWVNEDASDADKQQLIDDCVNLLGAIETVKRVEVGTPAGTPREVVDNSYGVSLIVYFKDRAGQDYYQTAQKHLDFIERNSKTWSKVQVYDMIPK